MSLGTKCFGALVLAGLLGGCAAPKPSASASLGTGAAAQTEPEPQPPVRSEPAMTPDDAPSTGTSGPTTSAAGEVGTPIPDNAPHAHPPMLPCTMPPADLALLVRSAAAVIDVVAPRTYARVLPGPGNGQQNPDPYHYLLTGAVSLRPGMTASKTYVLDAPAPLLPGSEYVLLLDRVETGDYFLDDGFLGAFLVSEGSVSFRCPNYDDPAHPIVSTGRTVSAADFRETIKALG